MSVGVRKPPNPVIMNKSRPSGSKGTFATFGLGKNILRALDEAGFQHPRPIQMETIPQALNGRDILGLAQTGTGKTIAFLAPTMQRLRDRVDAGIELRAQRPPASLHGAVDPAHGPVAPIIRGPNRQIVQAYSTLV